MEPAPNAPEKFTAPVVPPLRTTVKVRVWLPLLPSATDTLAGENEIDCPAGAVTLKAVVGNGASGPVPSALWLPLPFWVCQLAELLSAAR